jgi:hypothetical protein
VQETKNLGFVGVGVTTVSFPGWPTAGMDSGLRSGGGN